MSPQSFAFDGAAPDPDACQPVEVDGETIRVHGQGEWNEEDRQALGQIVRAAKRRFLAEQAAERAEIKRQLYAKLATELRELIDNEEISDDHPGVQRVIEILESRG